MSFWNKQQKFKNMKTVEQILEAERKASIIPIQKLSQFLYSPQHLEEIKRLFAQSPSVNSNPNLFNKSRLDLIKDNYSYAPIKYNFFSNNPKFDDFHTHVKQRLHIITNPNQNPGSAHEMMFVTCIERLGREEHKAKLLKKARNFEIIGCYIQTQIGHGSDISSLQTTATFSRETQQWIINTPSIQAAKYWPGEVGIVGQYGIVFAQAIVDSQNKGVYPFLVQIKDKDYNWMPGIEGGDIGPKIGWNTTENGYMLFNNVRIPKDDLINKYIQVSKQGVIKNIGDPRISFGIMMHVRELISCLVAWQIAIPIIVAVRYSLFRRQFRNGQKEEISIIEYQTQQDKILPRIAEYYAMSSGGNRIKKCCEENLALIQKNNFSLLQETHINLALGKCYYSEICLEGCEILRRSLGGHGISHYSGIASIWMDSAANVTGQGQNTVMYIQIARYVIKSYVALLKGKKVASSLNYVSELDGISNLQLSGKQEWTIKELRLSLLKGFQFVLGVVVGRLQSKAEDQNVIDLMNHKIGNRLQQLAQLHSVIFTSNAFIEDIEAQTDPSAKPILSDLCRLYIIGQIQRLSSPIVQAAFVCPIKFSLLEEDKQKIFARLRPIIVGLTDSFAIPQKYIRSQLARGHPYNNFLDCARQSELNQGIQESQRVCSNISQILAKHHPKL